MTMTPSNSREVTGEGPDHFVIFHCVSSGLNGADLGSDESEIVLLLYLVIDVRSRKVTGLHKYPVKPSFLEHSSTNGREVKATNGVSGNDNDHNSDENENDVNHLSEHVLQNYQLTEDLLKSASPLEAVIERFDNEVAKTLTSGLEGLRLLTDGQLHIRQSLFPEAQRKNITLPDYYYSFHDLRKEFMAAHQDCPTVTSAEDILRFINVQPEEEQNESVEIKQLEKITMKLICDDVKFHEPDQVQTRLEQGIRSKSDNVDTNCCVRARGLPWQASDQDIARFFVGLNVARGGVALCLSSQGRRNGEALILFENVNHRDMALSRHKHHIGNRYIEVYKATGEDFINVAGGNNKEAQEFLSRGGQVIIRMRGLPYDASAKQVTDFFASGETSCNVLDGTDGVLFVRRPDGRATGDAFVLFSEEDDSQKALMKHKDVIGSRYIELFRSTTAEVRWVLNRTMESHNNRQQNRLGLAQQQAGQTAMSPQIPLISQIPNYMQASVIPQQMITAGTRKDCIRLRGLPYEAQVEHILEFLGDHAKNIDNHGVHMVYNAQGQPSGEAFIQMTSEPAAYQASQNRHNRYMGFGKKQRYIEVFQCSGEDMNLVLTGNNSSQAANLPNLSVTMSPVASTPSLLGANTPASAAATPVKTPASAGTGILPPGAGMFPTSPFDPFSINQTNINGNHTRGHPFNQGYGGNPTFNPTNHPQLFYWPYPSPPISPNNYFGNLQANGIQLQAVNGHLSPTILHPHMVSTPPPFSVIKTASSQNSYKDAVAVPTNGDNGSRRSPLPSLSSESTVSSSKAASNNEDVNLSPCQSKSATPCSLVAAE